MTPTRTARRIVESGEALSVSNADIRALAEAYLVAFDALIMAKDEFEFIGRRCLTADVVSDAIAKGQKQPLQGEEE